MEEVKKIENVMTCWDTRNITKLFYVNDVTDIIKYPARDKVLVDWENQN